MKKKFLILLLFLTISGYSQISPKYDQTYKVDFKTVNALLEIYPSKKMVKGKMEYNFEILSETDSVYLDARDMEFSDVILNGKPASFSTDGKRLWIRSNYLPSKENKLSFNFQAHPQQTMYFINWNTPNNNKASKQVWTQGQGKYTSHWLPSFDDVREKAVFNLSIGFDKNFEVIANGELQNKDAINDSIIQWDYTMKKPMSSYLVAIAAGVYSKNEITTTSGIPVSLYYEPKDREKVEPTYRYTREIIDFLEKEIGFPYPWENYKQVPVQDFLFSGMENTETTIFANSLVVDSIGFNDRNYVNVNAHELAHQWFGNLVTAQTDNHQWLQEGFATYFALLAERKLFGDDYYYWMLYQSAEELKALSDMGKGQALLSSGASSLTYYQKGAWALHILREEVGDLAFKDALYKYLTKNEYSSVSTEDFITEVENSSGKSLDSFRSNWLNQTAFQGTDALNSLKKSEFIKSYMEVAALREIPFQNKKEVLEQALQHPVNDYTGQEVVFQISENSEQAIDLLKKAFRSNNLYVRQAIATSLKRIPEELKSDFVSLLNDKSYLTIENALLKLWLQYPGETKKWLEKTKGIEGFSNKNVEMLWLVINLVSPVENREKIQEYYTRLTSYTSVYQPFEVRQNAFGYLYQINAFSNENLIDLVKAGQHHNTRFRDYSRKLLEELLTKDEYRERFLEIKPNLEEKDSLFLNSRFRV